MDFLKKPPLKRKWTLIKCMIVCVLLVICLICTFSSLNNVTRYEKGRINPLILNGKITHVDVDYDSENLDDYHAMASYSYDGKKYTAIYRTFKSERKANALIGQTVTLAVDPEDPGMLLSELRGNGMFGLIFSCILLALAVCVLRTSHRESYIKTYGWRREAIKKDMLSKMKRSSGEEWLFPAVLFFCVGLKCPDTYLQSFGWKLVFLVIGVAGVVKLIRKLKRIHRVKSDAYVIRRDRFVSRETILNDEGPDSYQVTYENENGRWTKFVSYGVYQKAEPGDMIESVYLEGFNAPILSYSSCGESF